MYEILNQTKANIDKLMKLYEKDRDISDRQVIEMKENAIRTDRLRVDIEKERLVKEFFKIRGDDIWIHENETREELLTSFMGFLRMKNEWKIK